MYLLGAPGLLFLALTVAFGYSLLSALRLPLRGLEIAVASPMAGVIVASWLCLLPYLATGSLEAGIAVAALAMLAAIALVRPPLPAIERGHRAAVAGLAIVAFAFVFLCLLDFYGGQYYASYPFYGDASFHASMVTSFAEGYNYPPTYPMMAGQPLRYTFLMDFYSAALYALGLGLQWSIVLPGWLLLAGLLSMLYFLGERFFSRRAGGVLAVALVALSGGLGFAYAFLDLWRGGFHVVSFLLGNLNYTTVWSSNLVFTNFMVIVLAQRTALAGFCAGAFAMLLLYAVLVQRAGDPRGALLAAGTVTGLLPLFHVYSYIAILLSSALLFLAFRERRWPYFLAPALLLALPQALWLYGQMGVSHFRVQLGWMAGSIANIPFFWIVNMGLGLFLLVGGLFVVGKRNLRFYLPFLAIFAMANVFVFQPWDYDNHKFFSFWLMPSALPMAAALLHVLERPRLGKPLFAILLAATVLTGAMAAAFILFHPYVEFSRADVYVAGWIAENTPKDAVFLTSDSPVSPVTSLAGRKSYLGYGGWLSTHGIDFSERQSAVKYMYEATDPDSAVRLIQSAGIDYVYVGPAEESATHFNVSDEFFESRFACVFSWTDPEYQNSYRIYEV